MAVEKTRRAGKLGKAGKAGKAATDSALSERLHGLPPVFTNTSRLLILGSFPGVASLRAQQYYGHPRNHFWPIVGALLEVDFLAMSYPQRLQVLQARGLAVWDVYASCERQGSLDQAIRHAVFNDFASLQQRAPALRWVAHNGAESARAMRHLQALGFVVQGLPSTSPANASWSFERKLSAWRAAFELAGLLAPPGGAQAIVIT
jgi:hypoxanthine-DNA glycosylase